MTSSMAAAVSEKRTSCTGFVCVLMPQEARTRPALLQRRFCRSVKQSTVYSAPADIPWKEAWGPVSSARSFFRRMHQHGSPRTFPPVRFQEQGKWGAFVHRFVKARHGYQSGEPSIGCRLAAEKFASFTRRPILPHFAVMACRASVSSTSSWAG